MKILLTGALGQVGWELERALSPLGTILATDRRTLDLTDEAATRAAVRAFCPDWVVNAAAYTAVDEAERDEGTAMWMNAEVPRILAEEVGRLGGWMVHYSTDYVFDGMGTRPYRETDVPAPMSVYGHSKRAGELAIAATDAAHLLFRVGWVYGSRGRNFLRTIQTLARERDELRVVSDQMGVPTWCREIAQATALVIAQRPTRAQGGTYHLAGRGSCTWHDFAMEVLRLDPEPLSIRALTVRAITTAEFPTMARRPRYSVLDGTRTEQCFGIQLQPWVSQLKLCVEGQRSS